MSRRAKASGFLLYPSPANCAMAADLVNTFGGHVQFVDEAEDPDSDENNYSFPDNILAIADDGEEWTRWQLFLESIPPLTQKQINVFAGYPYSPKKHKQPLAERIEAARGGA